MAYLKYLRFSLIILFFTFFIYGCGTTMTLLPHHEKIDSINFQIPAKIEYDGNREYLPRSIIDDQKTGGKLLVRYTYHVSYGKENSIGREVVNLYNPLSLVGFPIGEDTLVVAGKIEFIKGT